MINKNPLIFAPLEGVSDPLYREVILQSFPHWDYVYTDFYRIPSCTKIPPHSLLEHFGATIYQSPEWRQKSVFQILASPSSNIEVVARQADELQFPWVDFNAGCPSKKVNAHHGGSWLLSSLPDFKHLLSLFRKNYHGFFSVKIRSGYQDTQNFSEILKIVEGEGADLLVVHPRTKIQLYSGHADWNYITQAVQKVKIPVIGNGDLLTPDDIHKMQQTTGCFGMMIGRGAVANPNLPRIYHGQATETSLINSYYLKIIQMLEQQGKDEEIILKRLKSLINFSALPRTEASSLLRSTHLNDFVLLLKSFDDHFPH